MANSHRPTPPSSESAKSSSMLNCLIGNRSNAMLTQSQITGMVSVRQNDRAATLSAPSLGRESIRREL